MGVTLALPLLEAMVPAGTAQAQDRGRPARCGSSCIEMVHGAAGSTAYGAEEEHVVAGGHRARASTSRRASSRRSSRCASTSPSSATPTCARPRRSRPPEIGGDHFRASAVFLTQAHPKQTMGSDVQAGISIDQLYAQRFGQDTPIPSMQLCIEHGRPGRRLRVRLLLRLHRLDQLGDAGRAAADDPRPAHGVRPAVRRRRHRRRSGRRGASEDRSILDTLMGSVGRLKGQIGAADQARLDDYLDDVREIERRIQKVEEFNTSGEAARAARRADRRARLATRSTSS